MDDWVFEKDAAWPFTVKRPEFNFMDHNQDGKLRCQYHPDRPAVHGQQMQMLCVRCNDAVQKAGGDIRKVNWQSELFVDPPTRQSSWADDKDDYWGDEHDPYDHDLADAQFQKQFEDGMARGEALKGISELEPWKRGAPGKGLIMNDGTVHTWNDMLIHHQQVAQLVGPRNVNAFIDQIHDDGSAAMGAFDPLFAHTLKPHGIRPYDMWAEPQGNNDFTFG